MRNTFILAILLAASKLSAATYSLEPSHTTLGFKATHMVVSSFTGKFEKFAGSFSFDDATSTLKSVSVTVDLASINTENKTRDDHARGKDFFLVEQFPTAFFVAKDPVVVAKGKTVSVPGTFTLHGVTKPFVLDVTYNGTSAGAGGKVHASYTITGVIMRSEFGLTWNKNLDRGGVMLADDIHLTISGDAPQVK
jgi:polyisoprenoid-binding protein YceI